MVPALFILLSAFSAAEAGVESGLNVTVDASTAAFTISVDGSVWLKGIAPVANWREKESNSTTTLKLVRHTAIEGDDPALGTYNETRFFWSAGGAEKEQSQQSVADAAAVVVVETAFQIFSHGAVLFEQRFPVGLPDCQLSTATDTPVLSFPAFAHGGREDLLGVVTWRNEFSQIATGTAAKLGDINGKQSLGRANGGPIVAFDAAYRSIVISPFENFLASTSSGPAPLPPPPPSPLENCSAVSSGATACSKVMEDTDVTGNKVEVGVYHNFTRTECCAACNANHKCQVWARPPGNAEDCWLVGGYLSGTVPSPTREIGCSTNVTDRSPPPPSSSSAASTAAAWWSHGISGEVQSIPSGFTHRTILTLGNGITGGLQQWGNTLRKAQQPPSKRPDILLSHLSYWTDNGAYYYLYGAKNPSCDYMAHGPMDQVLQRLIESFNTLLIPVRSIQLDDWWYIGNEIDSHDHMCVKDVSPKLDLFPRGLPKLPANISYVLYAPFFCEDNVYRSTFPFENSTFEHEKDADPLPNVSQAFYSSLFKHQLDVGVAMSNYEVDFLQDQTQWFADFVETVDGSKRWLEGMAAAALSLNVSVQYCMAHPAAFLEAMALPAVSNGRASGDYQTPDGNLLDYGTAAPFFAAIGIAPSKDNFWSTPNQPRPRSKSPTTGAPACDGGSRNVTDNFLHALVATLSTGPVGFSDALGYTNVSLIKSTCDSAGLLLKPSLPLAAIDRTFSSGLTVSPSLSSSRGPQVPAGSHVWATHTAVSTATATATSSSTSTSATQSSRSSSSTSTGTGAGTVTLIWYMVVAIAVADDWMLVRDDMWPPLLETQDVVVWDHSDIVGTAQMIPAGTPELASMHTPASSSIAGGHAFGYTLISPIIPSSGGWAFLGEPSKLTPVSVQRNFKFELHEENAAKFTVKIVGSATVGELVTAAAWRDGKVHTFTAQIDEKGGCVFLFNS